MGDMREKGTRETRPLLLELAPGGWVMQKPPPLPPVTPSGRPSAGCHTLITLAALLLFAVRLYTVPMLWRNSPRGRPSNAPAAFIHPCQPIVAKQPPTGPGWTHELKHDGYRLQIHVRDSRVRLYTMTDDWSNHCRIVEAAARIKGSAVMDAEVVCLDDTGVPNFDTLHSRAADHLAVACASIC